MASMTNPMNAFAGMTPEEIDIARKQRMADMLRGQSEQPVQGQMVSGHYIAPSWTQQLSKVLSAYGAGKMDREAADMQKKYGDQQRTDFTNTAQKYVSALRGTPETQTPYQADNPFGEDLGKLQTVNPAVAGSQQSATDVLLNSPIQSMQQLGLQQAMTSAKPTEWVVGERFNQQTGMPEKVMYNKADPTQVMPFGGQQAAKLEFVNGQGVNPYSAQPQGAPIPKQADMGSDLLIPDGKGGYVQNSALIQAKKDIAKSGASNQNVIVGKQETEEAKTVGKAFGENYNNILKSGMEANGKIARYQRLSQLLEGVNTGKLTPLGTEIASTAQSLGINIDPNLGNKQAAAALSNEMALSLRNPSGGAGMPGALSDKDREFLTGMVPGIDKTPQGRKMMTDTAIALAKRDTEVANLARNYRMKHGSIDDGFYQELQQYSDAHPLFKKAPSAPAGSGAKFLGFEK